MMELSVLVVDDEVRFLEALAQRLTLRDFDVTAVPNGQEAVEAARREDFDLAIVDLKMPGMPGEKVLEILKAEHPLLEVIILTGHGSVESAVDAMKRGADAVLTAQDLRQRGELLRVRGLSAIGLRLQPPGPHSACW